MFSLLSFCRIEKYKDHFILIRVHFEILNKFLTNGYNTDFHKVL